MINFKTLSDAQLVADTKRVVHEERQATLAVMDRLREIYSRSLHLSMGFSSLHEFAVVELGLSDGSAHRRIQSMRLCEVLPKAKEALGDHRERNSGHN